MCGSPWPGGLSDEGTFNIGDRLFRLGRYRPAAEAYYQLFFCNRATVISPLVSDDPATYADFKESMALSTNGRYLAAATGIRTARTRLPSFTDAGYMEGIFLWAAGDRAAAEAAWRSTIAGPAFATPDGTDLAQDAARAMLAWALRRSPHSASHGSASR